MGEIILLARNIFLNEEIIILSLTVQDNVCPLGTTTDIRSKHDSIRSITTEFHSIKLITTGKELDVCTAAINILFVLDGILDNNILTVRAIEGFVHFRAYSIKSCIFASLNSHIV